MLLRDFLPLDVFFKVAFWWAFLTVLGIPSEELGPAIRAYVVPAALSALGFYVWILHALWPLEIYRRGVETDESLQAAALAAHRAPRRVAVAAIVGYSVAFLGGALRLIYATPEVHVPRGAMVSVLFIEITILIGGATFGYLLMMNHMARATGAFSLRLLQRGLPLRLRATSLRRSNLLYGLGVGLTPVAMLTGMAVIGALRSTRAEGLLLGKQAATALALRMADGGALAVPDGAIGAMILDGSAAVGAQVGAPVSAELVRAGLAALGGTTGNVASVDDAHHVLGVARGGGRIVAVALADRTSARIVYWQCWLVGVFMFVFAVSCARYLSGNLLLIARRVARALREIGDAGRVAGAHRIPVLSNDELGVLVENANLMIDRLDAAETASAAAAESLREANQRLEGRVEERTAELRESHRQLEENYKRLLEARTQLAEAARAAGMAEVASSVLHNVGNVLNSVNVSAGLIAQRLRASKVVGVRRAVDIVPAGDTEAAAFLASDPRALALPKYLRRLGDTLVEENAELLREVGFLEKNIEHIKVIVSLQQMHAKQGGLVEPLRLAELCEDALRFGLGSLEPTGITVVRELDRDLEIVADRHRLFQIVVNLVRNARDAVRDGVAAPCIRVAARADGEHAVVEVTDNGCGITPENLTRIFNLGFTTKAHGHGYGLHSSAVAASELGGTLGVRSDGAGRGAAFALRLPWDAASGERSKAAVS